MPDQGPGSSISRARKRMQWRARLARLPGPRTRSKSAASCWETLSRLLRTEPRVSSGSPYMYRVADVAGLPSGTPASQPTNASALCLCQSPPASPRCTSAQFNSLDSSTTATAPSTLRAACTEDAAGAELPAALRPAVGGRTRLSGSKSIDRETTLRIINGRGVPVPLVATTSESPRSASVYPCCCIPSAGYQGWIASLRAVGRYISRHSAAAPDGSAGGPPPNRMRGRRRGCAGSVPARGPIQM